MVNLFGQDTAEKVLRFHLIKTDYEFFKAKNIPWIDELKQCRDELWETIDDSAKKYLNQFFRKISLRSLNDGYFEHN
jgi:hypothetical protein